MLTWWTACTNFAVAPFVLSAAFEGDLNGEAPLNHLIADETDGRQPYEVIEAVEAKRKGLQVVGLTPADVCCRNSRAWGKVGRVLREGLKQQLPQPRIGASGGSCWWAGRPSVVGFDEASRFQRGPNAPLPKLLRCGAPARVLTEQPASSLSADFQPGTVHSARRRHRRSANLT